MRVVAALVLVVPVVLTALLRGRRAAYVVAVASALVITLLSEPVGSLRLEIAEDIVALVVFCGVAFVVSTLVAARIELLGRIEKQRSALLRSVSHDLRTPLAIIEVAATDLRDGGQSAERTDELLAVIAAESRRLDRLVGNLLSLSRIDAGALVPVPKDIVMVELVDAAVTRLRTLFDDRDVTVDIEVPEELVLHADHALVEQVLSNLLENAVRHTPNGTHVRVSGEHRSGRVLLAVCDDGPGVPVELRGAMFEPFGAGGTGLAICRAVAEAHGGTIAVSDAPGGGAHFTVELPAG